MPTRVFSDSGRVRMKLGEILGEAIGTASYRMPIRYRYLHSLVEA